MSVVSLFDYSGVWGSAYLEYGYEVTLIDLSHDNEEFGQLTRLRYDVEEFVEHGCLEMKPDVLLMAPPCTHFALSGAQYWREKDYDGRTEESKRLVEACLKAVEIMQPKIWCLENPVGRLTRLFPLRLGRPAMYFHPYEYAGWSNEDEAYQKKTGLWGFFNVNLEKRPLPPRRDSPQGSWMQKLGGSGGEKTRELRSNTPRGFAKAFAKANRPR